MEGAAHPSAHRTTSGCRELPTAGRAQKTRGMLLRVLPALGTNSSSFLPGSKEGEQQPLAKGGNVLKPNKTAVRPSLTASSPCYSYYFTFGAIYLIKSATVPWLQLLRVPYLGWGDVTSLGWGDVTCHSQSLCHLSGNIRDPSGPLLQVTSWRSLLLGREGTGLGCSLIHIPSVSCSSSCLPATEPFW